jgi:hypothetical protein
MNYLEFDAFQAPGVLDGLEEEIASRWKICFGLKSVTLYRTTHATI